MGQKKSVPFTQEKVTQSHDIYVKDIMTDIITDSELKLLTDTVDSMDNNEIINEGKVLENLMNESLSEKIKELNKCIQEFYNKKKENELDYRVAKNNLQTNFENELKCLKLKFNNNNSNNRYNFKQKIKSILNKYDRR